MAEPQDSCILHNRLGTLLQVNNSEIGQNGTWVGTETYHAARFDNGSFNNNIANYITFPDTDFTPNKFIFEMVIKPEGWSITNGIRSDGVDHGLFSWHASALNRILFYFGPGGLTFIVQGGAQRNHFCTHADLDISDDELVNINVVYDRLGIDGGPDIVQMNFKGNQVYNSVANTGLISGSSLIRLLIRNSGVGAPNTPLKGTGDNVKIYNKTTTVVQSAIASNIGNEFWPAAPSVPTNLDATDGTHTTHIAVSWDAMATATSYGLYRSVDDITFSLLITQAGVTYNDTSAVAGVTYYYKVLATNAIGSSALSASDSGFRTIKLFDTTCDKTPPQILILSGTKSQIDLYKLGYVNKLPIITEQKTLGRDKLITNTGTLQVNNFDNFFSLYNSKSIFSNIRWLYETLQYINQDEELRLDAILTDIRPDHETKLVNIKWANAMFKERQNKVAYVSSDWETPATAFKNLADQEGFTGYNKKSVQDSINQYTAESCFIKCNINISDNITLQQAFEKIAVYGSADIFGHGSEIYFKLWQAFTGGIKVAVAESDFLKLPKLSSSEPQLINDYSINYVGSEDTPTTDSDQDNPIGAISRQTKNNQPHLLQIDGSVGQQIMIKDITSAVFIGKTYIKRGHKDLSTNPKPLTIIDFQVNSRFKEWIDLTSFININLSDEEWVNKPFEIFKTIVDDNTNIMTVQAYEVNV